MSPSCKPWHCKAVIHLCSIDLQALQWQCKALTAVQCSYSSHQRLLTLRPQRCVSDDCASAFRYWPALRAIMTKFHCVYVCVAPFSPKHIYKSQLNHMFENSVYLLHYCSSSSCLLGCHLILLPPPRPIILRWHKARACLIVASSLTGYHWSCHLA